MSHLKQEYITPDIAVVEERGNRATAQNEIGIVQEHNRLQNAHNRGDGCEKCCGEKSHAGCQKCGGNVKKTPEVEA